MNEAALNKIIEQQTNLIKKRYEAEAYAEKIKELNKENIELQQEGVAWYKQAWNSVKTMNNALATYNENEKSKLKFRMGKTLGKQPRISYRSFQSGECRS